MKDPFYAIERSRDLKNNTKLGLIKLTAKYEE
jgi:hypothetical protein